MARGRRPAVEGARARWQRDFLAALALGASMRGAARAAGVDHSTAYAARKVDADFAGRWAAAQAEGRGRLEQGEAPPLARDEIVRKSKHGRPCIMRVGPGRWSAAKEAEFLAHVEAGANVARAADLVGMSREAVYARRRREPGFAADWAEAVRSGYLDVEALLIENFRAVLSGAPRPAGSGLTGEITVADAMNLLKLHRSTAKGGAPQRYNWRAREPDIEEVRAEILRKVEAIKAQRRKGSADRL